MTQDKKALIGKIIFGTGVIGLVAGMVGAYNLKEEPNSSKWKYVKATDYVSAAVLIIGGIIISKNSAK